MTSGGADSGPNAGSNLVQGVGTNTATFTLPGSPRYKVESVVASVNNAAGGDTTGTLTVADQSGQVIAAGEQGRVISAGVTGRATWALRLADETTASIEIETAKATWTPVEVLAGVTKTLLPGRAGTIVYPADYLVTVTDNWNPVSGAVPPQLELESGAGTWGWQQTFDIPGPFSGGRWASWSSMIGEGSFTGWADQITGEGMRVRVLPNDLMTLTTGLMSVFVTARRIVWTA